MSAYTDQLQKIRAARKECDDARGVLYGLKMRHLALRRDRKNTQSGYVVPDAETEPDIAALREQLAETKQRLAGIERLAKTGEALAQRLREIDSLLEKYEQEARDLRDDARLAALRKRIAALRHEADASRAKLAEAEHQAVGLRRERTELERRAAAQQAELDRRVRQRNPPQDGGDGGVDDSRREIDQQITVVQQKNAALAGLIAELFVQTTPQTLIEQWNDSTPITLMPVRLETKFRLEGNQQELCVRVFPDDIAVVTHEKTLTPTEVDYGTAYWKALRKALTEDEKKTAWRMLADKFGANRSAWVARTTRPANLDSATTEEALQFPVFDLTKPASWTEAPHTRVLPDRFVLLGYRAGVLATTLVGNPVADIVTLGPAPMEDADSPSITRNPADNRLEYGADFQWLVDFDLAVKSGLGFRVRFDDAASARAGFDQLLVIGLKASADEADGKVLLEELFDNHHYSKRGLALVRQGTPTNNTDERDAGFSSKDPLQTLSYFTETGAPQFTPTDDKDEATDGQRLAEYLGIDYAPLQYVANAGARDHVEAVAMNHALYAGTLGYYLQSMVNEVMSEATIGQVRHHFTRHVTGRGPLASLRVGNQPYGILPTAAFDRWDVGRDAGFERHLQRLLAYLQNIWRDIVPGLPHIGKGGNAAAALMGVLGLQPTSVEYFQRIGYSIDYLKNLESFQDGGRFVWDVYKAQWDGFLSTLALKQLGYSTTRPDDSAKPTPLLLQIIFQHFHTQLDAKNLVDGLPPSEEATIQPYDEGLGLNYVHWLLNTQDGKKIEQEDFDGAKKPSSLLYMLLRHSLLHETSQSIGKFLAKGGIDATALVRSRKFSNISAAPTVSHWEVFQAPVGELVPAEASSMPLYAYVHSARFSSPADLDVVQNLKTHKWALGILKDMHTAPLERAFAEHLDTLSYRLDAWQTSLFDLRLRQQRALDAKADERRKGAYLGAYGYLENVTPALGRRTKVNEDVLPAALRESKDNLFVDGKNGGHVHAPSLNHATAAAILRNAYLTHATPADGSMLSVNLSSERVRRARYLVEGLRNGQSLEVLLGYLFERGLHEWSTRAVNPVILNDLVPLFRSAFPIKKTRVPQQGNTTGPEETIEDFHVVDGLALARLQTAFPYGITFPPLDAAKIAAIGQEKRNIENTLDALRDLLMSETAYQLALGNFDRASAVMQSISSSQLPTDIEVIESARGTSLAFTNRVVLHFDPALAANPWPAVAMSLRAQLEPGLNHWLGGVLGDPARTRCRVDAVDADGTLIAGPATVSLAHLGIQPLDFMYLIRNQLEASGTSELETRVRSVFAVNAAVDDGTVVRIAFADANAGGDPTLRSFAEVLPLANYLRELVTASRPLGAKDFEIASRTVTAPADNPDNIEVTELRARVQDAVDAFALLAAPLATEIADAQALATEAAVQALRARLRGLADAGLAFAFPQSARGFAAAQIEVLATQGTSVLNRLGAMVTARDALINKADLAATKPPERVALLTEATKLMLGDDTVVLPRFHFNNASDIAQAHVDRGQLLSHAKTTLDMPLVVDEWLHGVSHVRLKMHQLEMARLLDDALGGTPIEAVPIQLPYRANDSWLAVQFPPGTTIEHDTLSFILVTPQGFNAAAAQCGLMLDQWTEAIPNREELTGITFNYDNPNSVPPQVILLAVTPEQTGHWQWNHLVDGVLDTFARAKMRAVEPDQVDTRGVVTTLLPALLSEFSTSRTNVSLDYALNIAVVAQAVSTLVTLKG